MLIKKVNTQSKIILIIFTLFISSCDQNSFIIDSDFGDDFNQYIFTFNDSESGTFREDDFSSGNSSRTYLGILEDDAKVYSLYEIDLQAIRSTSFCSDTTVLSINELDFKIVSTQNLFDLYQYSVDSIDYIQNSIIDHELMGPQSFVRAYFINDDIHFEEESSDNYDIQKIEELESFKQLENLIPSVYNNYELTFILDNYISNDIICSDNQGKYYILVEYESNNNFLEHIELFSTDHSIILLNPKLHVKYLKESSDIEYQSKYEIVNIESDYLNSNQFTYNSDKDSENFGTLLSFSFENLELDDIDENLIIGELDTLVFQGDSLENFLTYQISLNPEIIDSISDISFYFDNLIFAHRDEDPENDNWSTLDSLGPEGNGLYDSQEYFYDYGFDKCFDQEEAGNGLCDNDLSLYNDLGTELNSVLDWEDYDEDSTWGQGEGEEWFDYGLDQVLDNYESGCFSDNYPYGIPILIPTSYAEILNSAFPESDEPQFDQFLYIPSEGCETLEIESCNENEACENEIINNCNDNEFCSWNELLSECYNIEVNICGPEYWQNNNLCENCSFLDPNGDNDNSDPSNDNYDDIYNIDGTELNGLYDLGEPFLDFGLDQIPDSLESLLEYQFEDDNWSDANPTGTENNGIYDIGEIFFDFGVDGITNIEENGYNVGSQENNSFDNPLNAYVYNELFNDFGVDNIPNGSIDDDQYDDFIIDPNNDSYHYLDNPNGLENNGIWDHEDVGTDGCSDIYETGNTWINEVCSDIIYVNKYDCLCSADIVDDEIEDPNNDNFNLEANINGTENNGVVDENENHEDWDDYGIDNIINEFEPGYLNNAAIINLGTNLYSFDLSEFDDIVDSKSYNPPIIHSNDQIVLWISNIDKISDYSYNIKISLISDLNINGFQLQLSHYMNTIIDSLEVDAQVNFYPHEYNDDDNDLFPDINELVENGEKYIKDFSLYNLNDFSLDSLSLSYSQGLVSRISFNELEYFIENNENALISDNLTKLKLFINQDESSIDEDGVIIKILVNDELDNTLIPFEIENSNSNLLSDIVIYPDTDSLLIPIAPLIQKMVLDDIYLGIDDKPYIYLGISDYSNNLSKVFFEKNNINMSPELEIFYTK